ncbi:MAG: HEAT repeat domain-containing protein [Verrucomicrobia bacterium]|nr:HEAT repeat domain-containing protein [Verrucomicrobiota bacterium]
MEEVATLIEVLRTRPQDYITEITALALDPLMLPTVRAAMVRIMARMEDAATLDALIALSSDTAEHALRAETIRALGGRTENDAEARLREIAGDSDDHARAMAMSLLGRSQDGQSQRLLTEQVQDPSAPIEVRNASLYALRRFTDEEAVSTLLSAANDNAEPARIRATALYSLGAMGTSNALPVVKQGLMSTNREMRYTAALAAQTVSDEQVSAQLVATLSDISDYPHVRKAASAALARNATPSDLASLRANIEKTDGYGVRLACDVFIAHDDAEAVPILEHLRTTISDSYVIQKLDDAIDTIEEKVP